MEAFINRTYYNPWKVTKFILNDFHSTYKRYRLRCYPWCVYEINDIFFIKSYKSPTSHFNINKYLQASSSNKRFDYSSKLLHHRCSLSENFYFHHIPRLWNDRFTASTETIKQKLYSYMWMHFLQEFKDNNVHSFHYLCPFKLQSKSSIYDILSMSIM